MGDVDLSGITPEQEEKIRSIILADFAEESAALSRDFAKVGPILDWGAERERAINARMWQRIRDYVVDGVEPVPDRETGLGAWSEEFAGARE